MTPVERREWKMRDHLRLAVAVIGALAVPSLAHAAEKQVNITGQVEHSCGVGSPDVTEINLHDLTGPDGKLDPAKMGSAVLGEATIADAWCNTPHLLKMEAVPMTLTRAVAYAQPDYMARKVTYDAKLVGWAGFPITGRPKGGGDTYSIGPVPYAYAAPSPGLVLQVSKLQTLSSAGLEQANLMLEYGLYRGTVTITLTTEN